MRRDLFLTIGLLLLAAAPHLLGQNGTATSTPHGIAADVVVRPYFQADANSIRVARDPRTRRLVYATSDGLIYRIVPSGDSLTRQLLCGPSQHGMSAVSGMAFAADGRLFLVGNRFLDSSLNIATIKRGEPIPGDSAFTQWSTVAATVPYPRSNTNYDHTFSGIVVSPDGKHLFVNSGSRTDHGELQTNHGLYPGMREVPLTSAIFRLPADSTDITLVNDDAALRAAGYLYADGTRNSFDLAFAPDGELFAADNSGDRDDSEELNWIREGRHYGFPWRMGTNNTPQQFPGYDPTKDLLVNKLSYGWMGGFYYDDSTYPAPGQGVTFTDPIGNLGPDAIMYRDAISGEIVNAKVGGISTFTAHRSPLGLVFDPGTMPPAYHDDAFITSWTDGRPGGSELLTPFGDPGQDLMHLELVREGEFYVMHSTKIAEGFNQPIDAEIIANNVYVLDFAGDHMIWEVAIGQPGSVPATRATAAAAVPNPCADRCRFVVDARTDADLTIDVFDILGRPVRRVHEGRAPAGPRRLTLDVSTLPAGAYTVRVAGGGVNEAIPVRVVH